MNISPEKQTGASGKRPSICALNDGRVIVGFDNWNSVGVAMETPSGGYAVNQLAYSSKSPGPNAFNASRLYVTSIATDGYGFIIAWRCGIKEWGSEKVYGPAVSDGVRSKSVAFCKGAARVAYDPVKLVYALYSKDGACREITSGHDVFPTANMSIGSTGEKLAFAIGPDGRRHAVMSGYSKQGSSYIVSGGKRVEWAAYRTYPDMSPDENYPAVALYNRNKALVCAVYGGQLRYNIIKGGVPMKNPASLPSMGEASKGDRMGPSAVKAGWGMRAFWRAGQDILMGAPRKATRAICEGSDPAACWNAERGCITLAYIRAGSVCVREIREG